MSQYIDSIGEERQFGNLIPLGGIELSKDFKVYGDNTKITPMIKEDLWGDRPLPSYAPKKIADQKSTNMCQAYSLKYAIEAMRRQMGLKEMDVSPGYTYGKINGGVDEGSTLPDGCREIMTGYVSTDVVAEQDFNPRNWPSNILEIAKDRRATEIWQCPEAIHIGSALLCGFTVVVGMFWGTEDNVDANGWLADQPEGEIAGGHALCTMTTARKGSRIGFKTPNTWSSRWGANGWCIIPRTRFLRGPFTGAYAIRQLSIGKGDLPDDVIIPVQS